MRSIPIVPTCLLALGMTLFGTGASAQSYANTASGATVGTFGSQGTSLYGETFVAPATELLDMSFFGSGGSQGRLDLVVASWNGSTTTGPALYTSGALTYTGGSQELTFSGIDLALVSGAQYIAYVSTSGLSTPVTGMSFYSSNQNGGLGGLFEYGGAGSWNIVNSSFNLQYAADFGQSSPVPEPASFVLLGAGLLGLGVVASRRRAG